MSRIKLGINQRSINKRCNVPIQLLISAKSRTTTIGLNVYINPKNWDDYNKLITSNEPKFKVKNKLIQSKFDEYEEKYNDLYIKGQLPEDAYRIRELLLDKKEHILFVDYLYTVSDTLSENSKSTYKSTISLIQNFTTKKIYFDDITPNWLSELETFYTSRKKHNNINALAVYMRNIRRAFNRAIDDNLVSIEKYPFRAYKIKTRETKHRTLTRNELVKIATFKGNKNENWARDIFMLSFYLIGINMKDLFNISEFDTRIEYYRSKTQKLYDIKIEPEAREIINNINIRGNIVTADAFKKKVNEYLHSIANKVGIKKLTTYYARHTWATFASQLDIPKETIAAALGHGIRTVTDIYINFDKRKIDKANRKVIEYVLSKD